MGNILRIYISFNLLSKKFQMVSFKDKFNELYKHYFLLTFTLCLIKLAPALLLSLVNPYISDRLIDIEPSGLLRGLALSMNTVFVFLTCMFFGHYSEWSNFGRNIIITLGILITAASSILLGVLKDYWSFFVLLSVSGIGTAATMCCAYSIILDAYPNHLVVLSLSHMEFFEAIGWTIGPLTFGTILEGKKDGVFYPFLSVGLTQICIAVYSAVVMHFKLKHVKKKAKEQNKTEKKSAKFRLKILFSHRETYLVLVINFVTCFCYRFLGSVMSIYLDNSLQIKLLFSVPGGPIGYAKYF